MKTLLVLVMSSGDVTTRDAGRLTGPQAISAAQDFAAEHGWHVSRYAVRSISMNGRRLSIVSEWVG